MQNLEAQTTPVLDQSLHTNETPASARESFDEIRSTLRNLIRNGDGSVRMHVHIDSDHRAMLELMRYGATTGGAHAYFDTQKGIFVIGGDIDSIPVATARVLTDCVAQANEKIHRVDDCRNEAAAKVTDVLNFTGTAVPGINNTGLRPSMPAEQHPQTIPETMAAF